MPNPARPCRHAITIAIATLIGTGPVLAADDDSGPPVARGTLSGQDLRDFRQPAGQTAAPPTTAGGGWIIIPRIDILGLYTDNALQVSQPRQWDFATIISPGLSITADTSRLQLRFDYAPILSVYARTTSQNALSHYLNTTGLLTLVPETLFVDMRASAGVQPITGGFGGYTGYGLLGLYQPGSYSGSLAATAALNRQNQAQTFTVGLSPYLLRSYGDYGTLRIGTSFQYSTLSNVTGFGTFPLVTSGDNAQSLFTTEQTARFVTGEFLGRIQNTTELTLTQTPIATGTTTTIGRRFGNAYSNRQMITTRTAYAISHSIQVFATIGYENLRYSGGLNQRFTGPVWNVGTTLAPNPDSSITVSYGSFEGSRSVTFDGRYALTPRTTITASYSSRLQTQLQNLQRQLNQGVINSDGVLVDSQTGAPLVTGNYGLALLPGLYRYNTFTLNVQTLLERDQINIGLISATQQSTAGSISASSVTARTVTATWNRDLRPDLSLNTAVSYTIQSTSGASGTGRTFAGSVGLNYLMTDSLTGRIRYSYFSREAGPGTVVPAFSRLSFRQNLFTIGITKQF